MIIIALGESIVVIGAGASGLDVDAGLLLVALLSLALSAGLWWLYFSDEDPLLITRIRMSTLKCQLLRLSHHVSPTERSRPLILSIGRIKDALNEFIQHGVELSIGLLGRQPFDQRPRKTRDEAVISAQTVVGLFPLITAR